ncbi:MAG: CHAT domain-containing protein [Acidimicrobiia bacterium]|nr:CHAT domain-containing protein [Acidimicrobiia bacterium]MBT8217139.1 CHAT domain-containing protein [Acidimicrobiia bacterium]NNL70493.1 CHAT domain-containing protein [Acidimicrobiia bacterium]
MPTAMIEEALALVDGVQDDPRATLAAAKSLLGNADLAPDVRATAYWAAGLASRQLNDLPRAERALTAGLDIAGAHGLLRRAAQIRSSFSLVRLYTGNTREALEEAERASADLDGADLARNRMQIGLIQQRLGDLHAALDHYEAALAGLRNEGDRLAEARLLTNRGVLHGYLGRLDDGVADLALALSIGRDLDQSLIVAACAHNLGFMEGRRGDVPAALTWFDQAEEAYDQLGRPPGMVEVLLANRAELLLSVGLFDEAAAAAAAALAGLERSDNVTDLSETRWLMAEVSLANGNPDEGLKHATTAVQEFTSQDRAGWQLMAEYTALRCRFASTPSQLTAPDVVQLGTRMKEIGLAGEGDHCLLLAGRLALQIGDMTLARSHLQSAARARSRGPAVGRAQAWLAEAMLREAEGNQRGALRAIDAGLGVIRDYRSTLGATDLRSYAAAHGLELARMATRLAIDSQSPWRVLRAVEDWRSVSRQVAAVRPPTDHDLEQLLAELRRVESELREAALNGEPTAGLGAQRTSLEKRIRSRERQLRGGAVTDERRSWTRKAVTTAVGSRTLLSFMTHADQIYRVAVEGGSATLTRTLGAAAARSELDSLLFSLNRLALGRGSPRSLAAAAATMEVKIASLRSNLLGGLDPGVGPVVVIPSGALHRVPWPALMPEVEVSVAPSLEAWDRASQNRPSVARSSAATLIAGPDLTAAPAEVAAIAESYRNPHVLTGMEATATSALSALDGAAVGHVAAHGVFRADNPSFSSLLMSDAPLTVYDLQLIRTPPGLMVLSSCDTGISKVIAGDELLGLSAALIDMGVGNLVAPIVPIADEVVPDLMADFHRYLTGGATPSRSLADVLAGRDALTDQERALRASFVCLGA